MDSLEEMDRFLEKSNLPRPPGRNRKYKQPNNKHWNQNSDQNSPKNQMALQGIYIKHLEKS